MPNQENGKSPKESQASTTEIVLPTHTNSLGTIFGGTVVSWIDVIGAVAAGRHARKAVVTASIDALHFIAPIRLGQIVHLSAMVNYTGRTSMEVGVRVDSEDPLTGDRFHNVTAYITFVALDVNRRPTSVPPVIPETEEEKRRFEQAKLRRQNRMKLANEMRELAKDYKA